MSPLYLAPPTCTQSVSRFGNSDFKLARVGGPKCLEPEPLGTVAHDTTLRRQSAHTGFLAMEFKRMRRLRQIPIKVIDADHANLNWVSWDNIAPLDGALMSGDNDLVAWLREHGEKPASEL